jgi:protein-L-isoaspartate(D-aspartate) O-methyltransferase
MDLDLRRRFFAEEIEAVCKLQSPALVEAFAAVPRERFLPPGPWTVLADIDFGMSAVKTRLTADADPARVYHNIAVAIDPARQLFNGQPGTIGVWIDLLELSAGQRVLHVGSGLGYFTALMAHCVGPTGRVVAYEVDEALAAGARANLSALDWVEVRAGDASQPPAAPETFDAILVNAGVTHPLPHWLAALAPGGRMMLPLTTSMAAVGMPGSTLGKGLVFLITHGDAPSLAARAITVVAIYSALGLRDLSMNDALGRAMMTGPGQWQKVTQLRRDPHDPDASCWHHGAGFCLSSAFSTST